jgi:hypothetical protein
MHHSDSLLKDLEYFYTISFYTNSISYSLNIWISFSEYLDIIDQLFGHHHNNKFLKIICYIKINWDISQIIFDKDTTQQFGNLSTHLTGLIFDYKTVQKNPQLQIVNCDSESLIAIIKQYLFRTPILQVSCVNTCKANHRNFIILRLD